jgi:hypothetical protein
MSSILNFFKEKLGGDQPRPNSLPRNLPPKTVEPVPIKRESSNQPYLLDSYKTGQDAKMLSGLPQRQNRPPLANMQRSQLDQSRISKSPSNGFPIGFNDASTKNTDPRQRSYIDGPISREVKNSQPLITSSTNPTSFKLPFNVETVKSDLVSLSDKSFPNPFPSKSTYPEYFQNELKQIPISQSAIKVLLENGSKSKLTKEEQIQKFINYKKEVEFYKKYIQINEAKKQKMYEELNEIKNSSFNNYSQNGGDGQLNREQNIMMQQEQILHMEKNELDDLKNELRVNDPATYAQLFGGQQSQAPVVFAPPVNSPMQFAQPKISVVNTSLNGSFTSPTRGNNMVFHNAISPVQPVLVSSPSPRNYSPYTPPQYNNANPVPLFGSQQPSIYGHRNESQNNQNILAGLDSQYNPMMRDITQNQSYVSPQQNQLASPFTQPSPQPQYLQLPTSKQPQVSRSNNPFMTQIK